MDTTEISLEYIRNQLTWIAQQMSATAAAPLVVPLLMLIVMKMTHGAVAILSTIASPTDIVSDRWTN